MAEDQKEEKRQGMRRGIKICLITFFVAFILAVVGSLLYLNWIINAPVSGDTGKQYFEIKQGETTLSISQNLKERDLVKSDIIFAIYSRIKGKGLVAGIYEIPKNIKMIDVFDIISNGKTKIVKFTIPEGFRAEQIGQLLEEKKLGSYEDFVLKAKKYEGQLFPDTYFISPDYTTDQIIETMHQDYLDRIYGLKLTDEDLVIASIVEREANKEAQRPIIAGIYKNRLSSGMKLQSDPTVQYGKDSLALNNLTTKKQIDFKFWNAVTNADFLTVDSAYNTYMVNGLPSGPICNPGIASISATINYTPSNYLYFIVANDQIYPATTYAEHKANVAKYLN